MNKILISLILVLSVYGCGGSQEPEIKSPSKTLVVYYGDSLVNHSGDRLENLLKIKVNNFGKDAQMTYHARYGIYGTVDFDSDALFVLSWGTNEDLQNINSEQYKDDMNYMITQLKSRNKLIVLESPLKGQFLSVLRELSNTYKIPLSVYSPKPEEFISDNVHLTGVGLNNRAEVLSKIVYNELTK
jgi:hypothetical protein